MVVDGVAESPLTFVAASSGDSGLFYGAAMKPAPFGTGLEVIYGLGAATTVAPTVLDAVMAAIKTSVTPPADTSGVIPPPTAADDEKDEDKNRTDADTGLKKGSDKQITKKLSTCGRPGE